ncbi:MAG: hypothetical protein ACLQVJ_10405 [Syntrophobacteraceae bacterium]
MGKQEELATAEARLANREILLASKETELLQREKALKEYWAKEIDEYLREHPGQGWRDALDAAACIGLGHFTDIDPTTGAPASVQETQKKIDAAVLQVQKANPDLSYAEALVEASRHSPGLFGLQTSRPAAGHMDGVRDRLIGSYLEGHPGSDYRTAYLEIGKEYPHLFDV